MNTLQDSKRAKEIFDSLQISFKAFSTDVKSGACRGEKSELLKRYIDEKIYIKAGA